MGTIYEVDQSTGAIGDPVIGDGPIIGGNAILAKIWENPDPTSSFASQDIEFNSSDYDMLLWLCYLTSSSNRIISSISTKGTNGGISFGSIKNRCREFNRVNDQKFTIGSGYSVNTYGTFTTDNDACIPAVVYGIKLKEV